ncbi:MAG TPA: hypothetical protein VHX66_09135 [Solirubrobacteraceae bacterium]|jgi:hypothetical protein|nr:hypothetical protein [Solirubrobacteraceae bacterium]
MSLASLRTDADRTQPIDSEGGPAEVAAADAPERAIRPLCWVILSVAFGVVAIAVADALSRTGHGGGSVCFWIGIAAIIVPATVRMASTRPQAGERVAIVVLAGLALYAVKLLRDPFSFTYADELVHFHNLQAILATGQLFGGNPILPITPRYPGLETTAAALARVGGVSPFAAAVMLIATARAMLVVGLYVLYERVSGSPRVAGLGALVYAATPTYLFFSAQFSYESLALPLATVAVFAVIRWGTAPDIAARRRWEAIVLTIAAAVVVTHHVTAYALVVLLAAVCLLHWRLHGPRGAPWAMTVGIAALAGSWLAFAAGGTIGYLRPVVTTAFSKLVQTINGEAGTRILFANQGGVETTPRIEEGIAVIGILVLAVFLVVGTRVIWQRRWRANPLIVLFSGAGIAYFATLPLRLIPAAWESASRSGEFLFVGVGVTAALGMLFLLDRGRAWRAHLVAWGTALVIGSGIIAGWPSSLRLALPLRVSAGGHTLESPSYVAARWSGSMLGPGQRIAAEDSDARLLLDVAHQTALTGIAPDVDAMLTAKTLQPWRRLLANNRIALVETDSRRISQDIIAGYFFDVGPTPLFPAQAQSKFDLPNVDRLYDGGNIVIYGVRGLW